MPEQASIRTHWKHLFRKDIESKIRVAEQEYQRYHQTRKVIYLQQAGNKMFSAVENFLMLKYNRRARSYQELARLVRNNKNDRILLKLAATLHYFFYNGELQMLRWEAESNYREVRDILKNRMR